MIYTGNNAFPEPWQIGAPISSFSLQGGENWVLDHLRGSSNLELICDIRMCPKISGKPQFLRFIMFFSRGHWMVFPILSWLVVYLPLWKIWVRQLGLLDIMPNIWTNKTCYKPPTRFNDYESPVSQWWNLTLTGSKIQTCHAQFPIEFACLIVKQSCSSLIVWIEVPI